MDDKLIREHWAQWTHNISDAFTCIRADRTDWTLGDFIGSGLSDYQRYFQEEEKLLPDKDSILEIGAGVGRILYAIHDRFKQKICVDMDPGMISLGTNLNGTLKRDGMDFRLCGGDGFIPCESNLISYVISIICFQHIPSKKTQIDYIKEIERILKPGGVAKLMIQKETYKTFNFDCGVGAGLSIDDIKGALVNCEILSSEDAKWHCQDGRNWFVTIKKNI